MSIEQTPFSSADLKGVNLTHTLTVVQTADPANLGLHLTVLGNRVVNISVGQLTWNDKLGRHLRAPFFAALRTR
jgi:hypothetical protein